MRVADSPIERLRDLIKARGQQLGLTQNEVARRSGMDPGSLSNIMTGKVVNFPASTTLQKLAKGLRLDIRAFTDLLEEDEFRKHNNGAVLRTLHEIGMRNNSLGIVSDDEAMIPNTNGQELGRTMVPGGLPAEIVMLPLYGPVACGEPPSWSLDDAQESYPVPRIALAHTRAAAVFQVSGDSMTAEHIKDGDFVMVRPYNGDPPRSGDIVIVEAEGGYVCKMYQKTAAGSYLESRRLGQEPTKWRAAGEVTAVGLVVGIINMNLYGGRR